MDLWVPTGRIWVTSANAHIRPDREKIISVPAPYHLGSGSKNGSDPESSLLLPYLCYRATTAGSPIRPSPNPIKYLASTKIKLSKPQRTNSHRHN